MDTPMETVKAKLVTILKAYVELARQRVKIAKALHERGAITMSDVIDAEYRALEAEMWLNEEKAR